MLRSVFQFVKHTQGVVGERHRVCKGTFPPRALLPPAASPASNSEQQLGAWGNPGQPEEPGDSCEVRNKRKTL